MIPALTPVYRVTDEDWRSRTRSWTFAKSVSIEPQILHSINREMEQSDKRPFSSKQLVSTMVRHPQYMTCHVLQPRTALTRASSLSIRSTTITETCLCVGVSLKSTLLKCWTASSHSRHIQVLYRTTSPQTIAPSVIA